MAKYQCNYCQGDISGLRIKCSECPDFDLCLQCFSCGAESGPHKRDHDYHIAGDDGASIGAFDISNPWSMVEEMMLLDAVEQYGFGNWEDVANHVESRSGTECEEHYVKFFIQGTIGREILNVDTIGSNVTDHSCPDGGPLSPSITVPISPLDLNIQEQHELGYMPYRDDFEREHDNEAEALVSSLANNYDDEDIDVEVKLAQVDRYRTRLKERLRWKCVAREFNLIQASTTLGKQKCPTPKKKSSKEEKDPSEKLKVFCQFHSLAEHETFLENMQKGKELKSRIKSLIRYRKNGITKLDDIEHFEEEKFKRDKKRDNKKKLGNSSPLIKRGSMVSKKAAAVIEEKLDILIDDEESKDEDEENDSKEMAAFPGYDMLSERERKVGMMHVLTAFPGYNMLSERERQLCNSIGMTPGNYLTIKTCIIKDYLQRRQGLPKIKIRYPSGLDKTHRRKIMSFLTDNGWIGVT